MAQTKTRRVSFETVGSISAIVVAVASLFVAWDEARSVRRQQAASVLPIIKIQTRFMNDETERSFSITMSNVGVGPAFIDEGRVVWDGAPVAGMDAVRAKLEATAGSAGHWTGELQGQVLGGGESYPLYEMMWDPADEATSDMAIATAQTLWRSLQVEACYCSVYDRCWRTDMNRAGRPDRAARCEVAAARR